MLKDNEHDVLLQEDARLQKKQYEQSMKWLQTHIGIHAVSWLIRICTCFFVTCYLLLLVYLIYQKDVFLAKALYVPAVSFLVLSLFRHLKNAPRPYEVYHFRPMIKKETRGNSFPSRHVFCAFIIMMTVYQVSVAGGIVLLVPAVIIAVLRVMSGVHFPKDVVAGAGMGILFGLIGYLWI
jgi:membrane-associated phospholipid phosphatase